MQVLVNDIVARYPNARVFIGNYFMVCVRELGNTCGRPCICFHAVLLSQESHTPAPLQGVSISSSQAILIGGTPITICSVLMTTAFIQSFDGDEEDSAIEPLLDACPLGGDTPNKVFLRSVYDSNLAFVNAYNRGAAAIASSNPDRVVFVRNTMTTANAYFGEGTKMLWPLSEADPQKGYRSQRGDKSDAYFHPNALGQNNYFQAYKAAFDTRADVRYNNTMPVTASG